MPAIPHNDDEQPLERVDGWSIWPVIDGLHLATRDRPLDDREIRTVTLTRSLYATTRGSLLAKIDYQNQLAAHLRGELAAQQNWLRTERGHARRKELDL